MFQDNLKALRKEKGFTQESLAIELHVVRQTVSKWEKGLSVPDAEMLQKLSEVLETPVARLLGAELPREEAQRNEIAEQLAKINEQLAIKNRRNRRVLKGVLIALAILVLLPAILFPLLVVTRHSVIHTSETDAAGTVSFVCELNGKEYPSELEYDKNYQIVSLMEDFYISDHLDISQYTDANVYAAHLFDWFTERGGTVRIAASSGEPLAELPQSD